MEAAYQKVKEESDKAAQEEIRAQQALVAARGRVQKAKEDEAKTGGSSRERLDRCLTFVVAVAC